MTGEILTIIGLYLLGIAGVVGCFCGAKHHAVPAMVCLIIATRMLQDLIHDSKELRRKGGLNH